MNRTPRPCRTALLPFLVGAALLAGTGAEAAGQDTAPAVRKAGLLPPVIVLFEDPGAAAGPTVRADWSSAAAGAVSAAFAAEMAARNEDLVVIGKDELGSIDPSPLYGIPGRIVRGEDKPLPEQLLAVEYPPASVAAVMDRHQLDGVWVVTGIAVLRGAGARTADTPPVPGDRLLIRAALVDRRGAVRYSDVVDSAAGAAQAPPAVDLRDPQVARTYAGAVLAEYRTEQDQRNAAAAVVQAQEVKAAEQREKEKRLRAGPPELRVGFGIFFVAPDGVDLLATFRQAGSNWQFGYRYVRWTDTFSDPFTGHKLTETTDTMQGPQVNYLFTPEENSSWYLGISVLRWSRTEVAVSTGASDSDAVTAPFFGGGWTARLGKYAFFTIGILLSPGTELKTDTGVSSEEQSGGFDIQLQLGAAF